MKMTCRPQFTGDREISYAQQTNDISWYTPNAKHIY